MQRAREREVNVDSAAIELGAVSWESILIAGGVTASLIPLVRRQLERRDVVDVPGERTSHDGAIPRGAGLAICIGVSAAILMFVPRTAAATILLVATVGFAVIGLLDDFHPRPALARLVGQSVLGIVISVAATWELTESAALGVVVALIGGVWLVSFVNAFNFMDGINGISATSAAIIGVAYAIIGLHVSNSLVSAGGVALAAACLAFLPFNFPNARIFLGDVGSYFVGALIASLSLFAFGHGANPVALILPLTVYLTDTSVTLARRIWRGAPILEAHREHLYQRLGRSGLGVNRTIAIVSALNLVCAACGVVVIVETSQLRILAAVFVTLVVAIVYVVVSELYLRTDDGSGRSLLSYPWRRRSRRIGSSKAKVST